MSCTLPLAWARPFEMVLIAMYLDKGVRGIDVHRPQQDTLRRGSTQGTQARIHTS